MIRTSALLAGIILCVFAGRASLAVESKEIAVGDWSKPVADNRGRAIRGRLLLCEKRVSADRREVAVYIELQDVSEAVGETMLLFGDFGRTDFRPEYKGGLRCQLRDKDDKPVKPASFPFGGGIPGSQWVMLPSDASIRLRATPFGMHQPNALAICPGLGTSWVIGDDDPGEYFLSGTFTIDPAADRKPPSGDWVWRGTIELPPARIVNRTK
jgi:hypothetical protein